MANRHILKTLDKVIEYGWLTVVLAVPLYFNVYSQRVFEPDKVALFRSIVGIMALAWVIKGLEKRLLGTAPAGLGIQRPEGPGLQSGQSNKGGYNLVGQAPSPLPWLVLALAGVYLLSTATALSPRISFWGSYEWRQGAYTFLCYIALFLIIARNLRSEAQMTRLVTAVLYASLPISLYGISQYLGLDPLPWQWTAIGRAFSTMGHPNFLGAYLTMVIPLTATRLLASPSWIGRLRYVLLILLQLGCLLLTFSRSSWLALTVSALVFAFLLAFPMARGRFFVLVALLASLLLIMAALAYLDPKGIFSYSPLEPLHSFLRGKSATARIRALTWEGATQLIAARPFLGYGPESFPLAFPRVYPPQLAVYGGLMATGEHAHNEELDLSISVGLLGTAVYLLVLTEVFRQGWRALRHVTPMANTIIGLLSGITAYLIQNQLSFATTA
ncbi:MAG: O-antigen ligase family protein, partial [Anaerolineae bacterium]